MSIENVDEIILSFQTIRLIFVESDLMEFYGDTGSSDGLWSAHGQMDGQVVALSAPLVDERPSQL